MNKRFLPIYGILILAALSGCSTSATPPLTYIALERPVGTITTRMTPATKMKHNRGGPYFLNYGFRPVPDVGEYLAEAHAETGCQVLRNADIQFQLPFAADIFFFGWAFGGDVVTVNPERTDSPGKE